MAMSAAKFQGEYNGLNQTLKSVLDAVPKLEEWGAARIQQEVNRGGRSLDIHKTKGCLDNLVKSGLVREPKPGMFIREIVKDALTRPTLVKIAPAAPPSQTEEPMPEEAPIEKLSGLSSKLREIADAIDNAAIEIADRISSESEETNKLKQLQKLLKELG